MKINTQTERHLPLTGGYNFRDLGGYSTVDGKCIKWGKVFRSDDLYLLTPSDLIYLANIPLFSIVDFRSESEMLQAPDKLPASVKNVYDYPIAPGNLSSAINVSAISAEDADRIMREMNVLFVTDPVCIDQYRKFFRLLQQEDKTPLLFHCSAGKDRTGMASALFLYSLGVDEDTIMEDYLLSNEYLGDKYSHHIQAYPALEALFRVKPSFLRAALDQLKKDHGSVKDFLKNVLEVDIKKMEKIYLY